MENIMDAFIQYETPDGLYVFEFERMDDEALKAFYAFQWILYTDENVPPYMGVVLDLRKISVVPFAHMLNTAQAWYSNDQNPFVPTRHAIIMEERTFTRLGIHLLHTLPTLKVKIGLFEPQDYDRALAWLREPMLTR